MSYEKDLEILKNLLANDSFAAENGIEYEEVSDGYCRAKMKVTPKHLNFLKAPHGGAVFTLADAVFAGSCNAHGELAVAVSVTIDFMSAVKEGAVLVAEGSLISRTRKIGHYRLEVKDGEGNLVSQAKGTAYFLGKTFTEWEKAQKEKK